MALASLIPTAVSALGGLFGKKKKGGETVQTIPAWQQQLQESLARYGMKGLNNFNPGEAYTGELSAPMAYGEGESLSQLVKFLQNPSGTGDLFKAGKQQVLDTLGGRFADPKNSPYIQAMTALSNQNLDDLISENRGRRGARGTYYTKAGIQDEGRLTERVLNNLNAEIGQFQERERGRQFGAVPLAGHLDEYEQTTAPLSRISAGQNFGALPRTLQQADMEKQYQDFLRQRSELGNAVGTATGLAGMTPYPREVQMPFRQENNTFGNVSDIILKLLPLIQGLKK